jgi:head-tail adaptor
MSEVAGLLSERVRFERQDAVRGPAGDRAGAWLLVSERWARVEPVERAVMSGLSAETRHSTRRWRVTVRSGVALALDMRVVWRGLPLKLTGIEEDPAAPGVVTLWAEDPAA